MASLRHGDVFISAFLPSTGGHGSEQRYLSLPGRKAGFSEAGHSAWLIIITKARESKSKKLFHCGVRIGFFLQQSVSGLGVRQMFEQVLSGDPTEAEKPRQKASNTQQPCPQLTHSNSGKRYVDSQGVTWNQGVPHTHLQASKFIWYRSFLQKEIESPPNLTMQIRNLIKIFLNLTTVLKMKPKSFPINYH